MTTVSEGWKTPYGLDQRDGVDFASEGEPVLGRKGIAGRCHCCQSSIVDRKHSFA